MLININDSCIYNLINENNTYIIFISSYEAGIISMAQSQFDNAVSGFSKAILLQPHQVNPLLYYEMNTVLHNYLPLNINHILHSHYPQTQFYVQRAEAYLQLCDFQSAALDYKHARRLEPQTEAYHQRLAFIHYLQVQELIHLQMREIRLYYII